MEKISEYTMKRLTHDERVLASKINEIVEAINAINETLMGVDI